MPRRTIIKTSQGQYRLSGQNPKFLAYEKALFSGEIKCPFIVEFRDTTYESTTGISRRGYKTIYITTKEGKIIHDQLVPLTPEGKPKISLFD